MSHKSLYLKPNVVVEPLVDRWYCWSHLLSPATAAMNIAHRHLAIMQSFINAPQVHAAAVANPDMLGGPFIDYGSDRVPEIRDLIAETKKTRAHMLEFAEAIRRLDDILRKQADGHSIEPLYAQVPELLRGYVELVYDLNNHPSFRLFEALLYHSPYYNTASQSLMFSLISGDDRPFVLSTPRLDSDDSVHLHIPFASESIDDLFGMKKEPRPYGWIKEKLGVDDADDKQFQGFFTDEAPPPYERYTGEGVRWRYFGHACILIETKDVTILSDPVLSYTFESNISRYSYQDLPDSIDYVLITHNHQDHIMFETMLQLRRRIQCVVVPRSGGGALQDPSLKLLLQALGFKNVIELDEMETLEIGTGTITGLPFLGEHADLNILSKLAFLVRIGRHSLMLVADSCNLEPKVYEYVQQIVGDVDILFLGMECDGAPLSWVYGPLLTKKIKRAMDQSRRLAGSNYERGIDLVRRFGTQHVYVYAMGQEPWLNYVMSKKYTDESNPIIASNTLLTACNDRGILAERLFGEKEILLT